MSDDHGSRTHSWFSDLGLVQQIIFGTVVVILLFVLVWVVAGPQTPADRINLIQIYAGFVAATVVAIGSYVAWRNLRISQETLRIGQENLQLTREGHVTDRFTSAIDQLGATNDDKSPKIEIRLGGIYALERIAHDPSSGYDAQIQDTLTAYIRQNAASRRQTTTDDGDAAHTSAREHWSREEDIVAILEVLHRVSRPDRPVNLSGVNLSGINLAGANFSGALLRGANLSEGGLLGANLSGADLAGAFVSHATLAGASLRGADLTDASLNGSNLSGADLIDANLLRADLTEAYAYGAYMSGADLTEANLYRCDMREVSGLEVEQLRRAFGDESTHLDFHNDIWGVMPSFSDTIGHDTRGREKPSTAGSDED